MAQTPAALPVLFTEISFKAKILKVLSFFESRQENPF
jgi:hypothetical protein